MKIFLNLKSVKVNCQKFFDWKKGVIINESLRKFVCLRETTWSLINERLSKRKDQSFLNLICMPENQVLLNDKKEIADTLSRHFAKIGETLPHQDQVVK